MATTEVILRDKIKNLGAEGDIVKVKAGYARNFLVPQAKAYDATEENKKHLADLEAARVKREAEDLANAEKLAGKIKKLKPVFKLETGEGGKAFGAITNINIHDKLVEEGIEIDRHIINLDKPIKSTGTHEVDIRLHPEVSVFLRLEVKSDSEEEAAE